MDWVNVRPFMWTIIGCNWCPYEKGSWAQTSAQREGDVKNGEDTICKPRREAWYNQPILTTPGFQINSLQIWDDPFLLFKLPICGSSLFQQPQETHTTSSEFSAVFSSINILVALTTVILIYQYPTWNLIPQLNTSFQIWPDMWTEVKNDYFSLFSSYCSLVTQSMLQWVWTAKVIESQWASAFQTQKWCFETLVGGNLFPESQKPIHHRYKVRVKQIPIKNPSFLFDGK